MGVGAATSAPAVAAHNMLAKQAREVDDSRFIAEVHASEDKGRDLSPRPHVGTAGRHPGLTMATADGAVGVPTGGARTRP